MNLVKKRKLRWFGNIPRSSGLAKTILQGTVEGKRRKGRQKKRWEDNIKQWAGLDFAGSTKAAKDRTISQGLLVWQRQFCRAQCKEKERNGRQKKRWEDNSKEWAGLDFAGSTRAAEDRTRWKGIVIKSLMVPQRPRRVVG